MVINLVNDKSVFYDTFILSIIFLWADRLGSMLDLQVSQPFAKFAENPVWIFQNLVFYSECYCITRLIVGASNYS